MTDEVKLRIAALRWSHSHDDCTDADDTCPVRDECFRYISVLGDLRTAADLIESLAAELEQVKRERNAAIRQLLEADKNNPFACSYCKHDDVCDGRLAVCGDCGMDGCPCNTCINHSNWQWRGVKEG